MNALPQIKRGDTFSLACTWKECGQPSSVAGFSISSQIRTQGALKLVATLEVIVADQVEKPGSFTLLCTDTSVWPVGTLVCDIAIAQDGVIRSSEAFVVPVVEGVTR